MPSRCSDCLVACDLSLVDECPACGLSVCRWCYPAHEHCRDCGVPVGLEPCRCPTCREPFCASCTIGETCPMCDECFERKRPALVWNDETAHYRGY